MKFLNSCLTTAAFVVASIVVVDAQRNAELFVFCVYGAAPTSSNECKLADEEMLPVFTECVDAAYGKLSETPPTDFRNALDDVDNSLTRHLRVAAVEPEEAEVEPEGTDFSMAADFSMVTGGEHRNLGGSNCNNIGSLTPGQIAACCLVTGAWQTSSYCGGGGGRRRLGAELVAVEYLEPLLNVVDETCTAQFRATAKRLNTGTKKDCFPDPNQGACRGFYITV